MGRGKEVRGVKKGTRNRAFDTVIYEKGQGTARPLLLPRPRTLDESYGADFTSAAGAAGSRCRARQCFTAEPSSKARSKPVRSTISFRVSRMADIYKQEAGCHLQRGENPGPLPCFPPPATQTRLAAPARGCAAVGRVRLAA